jgi:hypothetical protein
MNEEETALIRCLDAENYNGFGFQCSGTNVPGSIVFARICGEDVNENEVEKNVRERCRSETFRVVEFLGRYFVVVHYREWELIPVIFNYLLTVKKYSLLTNNQLQVYYDSTEQFGWREMELKFLDQFQKRVATFPIHASAKSTEEDRWRQYLELCWHGRYHVITWHWNFCTPQGKEFCTKIRRILGKPLQSKRMYSDNIRWKWHNERGDELFRKYRLYHHGTWSRTVPSFCTTDDIVFFHSQPQYNNTLSEGVTEEESLGIEMCFICYERVPNTIVEPCGHMCVCRECAEALKKTNDATVCVRCRRKIENVVQVEYSVFQ